MAGLKPEMVFSDPRASLCPAVKTAQRPLDSVPRMKASQGVQQSVAAPHGHFSKRIVECRSALAADLIAVSVNGKDPAQFSVVTAECKLQRIG